MLMRLYRQEGEQLVMRYEAYRAALYDEMDRRMKLSQQQQIALAQNTETKV